MSRIIRSQVAVVVAVPSRYLGSAFFNQRRYKPPPWVGHPGSPTRRCKAIAGRPKRSGGAVRLAVAVAVAGAPLFLREIGYGEFVEHIGEDDLERYAMWSLPESGCATLEEHLLICSECRDRLESTDEYVAAMRSAAAKIRESGKGE